MNHSEPLVKRLYSIEELVELRRNNLRYARSFPPGDERNRHRRVATSLRALFKDEKWLHAHTLEGTLVPWFAPVSFRNETWSIGFGFMVRIDSRNWTPAQTARLIALLDDGTSPASIAVSLKRSITVIRAKARNLGKSFPIVASRSWLSRKDGVPLRDRIGIGFNGNLEAIAHCKELAQHFRDDSLRDEQDLEISVVNAPGREIHREFVHWE
jgi:hypothetical protein